MWLNVLQGLGVLGLLAALVALGLRHVHEEAELRTMVFASLVFANLALIFTQRSWSRSVIGLLRAPNPAMWWVVIGALAGLALVLSIPGLRGIFRFEPLGLAQLTVCVGLGAASMLLSTGLKRLLPAPPKIAR
jgi:Ca2+-transporting ATPase